MKKSNVFIYEQRSELFVLKQIDGFEFNHVLTLFKTNPVFFYFFEQGGALEYA